MNKAIHKLTFLLSLAVLFAACSRDDDPVTVEKENPDAPQFTVTRSTGQGGGELATVFKDGTEVGLSVQENSTYANMKYAYRGGTLYPAGENIVWERGVARLTVDAYYPYRSDGAYANPSVLQDQSTESNYYASDALICAAATVEKSTNKLSLTFKHRTAKMIFTFAEDVDEVSIANQALTQGGSANNVIKAYKASDDGKIWKACIIPITGEATLNVRVTENGQTADFSLESVKYESGKQYSYTMNLQHVLDLSKGNVTINGSGTYTITQSKGGTTSHYITINGSPTVTIRDLNIQTRSPISAIGITDGAPTIILEGTNTLVSGVNCAGLGLSQESASVTIRGKGTLNATGGAGAAGIGAMYLGHCGNIIIDGGTIVATATEADGYTGPADYAGGAGIGGVLDRNCGNISIANAIVTATGNNGGAGIGAGLSYYGETNCGTIFILNSDITAKGSSVGAIPSAAIGCGGRVDKNYNKSYCANISIILKKGQSKSDFLNKLTVAGDVPKVGVGDSEKNTITWYNSNYQEIK